MATNKKVGILGELSGGCVEANVQVAASSAAC